MRELESQSDYFYKLVRCLNLLLVRLNTAIFPIRFPFSVKSDIRIEVTSVADARQMAWEKTALVWVLVFLLAIPATPAKPSPSTSPTHKKRGADPYGPPHPTHLGAPHHGVTHDPGFFHLGGTPAPFVGSPTLIGTPAGGFIPHDHIVGVVPPAPTTLHEHFHHHVHEVAPHAPSHLAVHHPSYVLQGAVPAGGGLSLGVGGGAAAGGGLVAVPGSHGYGPVLGVYHGVYHGYGVGGPTHHPALTYG